MSNPCSPIIDAGSALIRAARHAVVHKARFTGIGHAGAHLHAPALPAAPLYGPPAPQVAALCSKTPGTALAAGPGAPAGAAPVGAAPVGTAADVASAAPSASGVPAGGAATAPALPGVTGVSTVPILGATKAALLATALAAGLGTTAIAFTPAPNQPTTASTAGPDSTPAVSGPDDIPVMPLIFGTVPFPGGPSSDSPFFAAPSPTDQIPDTPALPDQAAAPPQTDTVTPVPEPASLLTLALGGALATLCRRRR